MKTLVDPEKRSSHWLIVPCLVVLLLGIVLRFTNLEQKVYWIDEVHTSLRVSGYTRTEFVTQAPTGVVGREELQKFQRLSADRNFAVGVKAIASSEHSPLYYVLTRLSMQAFGSSTTVTRGVAAVISLLSFPCLYLLAQELFGSTLAGGISVMLLAVSPVHLLYAQEAREYSLLAATILGSCWLFLRAMRLDTSRAWLLYALSVALGLYTQPLAVLAFIAHGLYGAIAAKFKRHWLKRYAIASGIGICLFSPWIWVFIVNGDGVGGWIEREINLGIWLQRWCLNLSGIFFDLQAGYKERLFDVQTVQDPPLDFSQPITFLLLPILLLIAYSLYYLVRNGKRLNSLFILLMIGVTAALLGLPDLISGGQRSTISRYIIPVHLGIELAVAYCLASQITQPKTSHQLRRLWQIVTVLLVSIGLWCCIKIVTAPTWWNKYSSYYNPQVAAIIRQSSQPLILGNSERISRMTSLSYLLPTQTKFLLYPKAAAQVDIPVGYTDVFLFNPYEELIRVIQNSNVTIEPIEPTRSLWQVK